MPYEFEMWIDGQLVRRDNSEFRPNVIAMMVENLPRLNKDLDTFEFKVKHFSDWKDLKPKVNPNGEETS